MSTLKTVLAVLVLAGMILALPGTTHAATWTHRTVITFKEPVQIPGMTLDPGTYIFEDSSQENHLVRIYDKSGMHLLATLMTTSAYRREASDVSIVFEKAAPGAPRSISEWFEPNQTVGREFVYLAPSEAKPAAVQVAADGTVYSNGALDLIHRSDLFFTEPVEIPGMTLQPGGYIFKFSLVDNHVVQIYDASEKNLLTSVMTTSAYRTDPDSSNVVFEERPAGTTRALSVWYEAGSLSGREFVYAGASAEGAK